MPVFFVYWIATITKIHYAVSCLLTTAWRRSTRRSLFLCVHHGRLEPGLGAAAPCRQQHQHYLSYSNRHADLLFELINRRHQIKSTLVTTNRAFAEWGEVFPNAACVVSLIDRLLHRAEVVRIVGDSYRKKEADERLQARTKARAAAIKKPVSNKKEKP